MCADLCSSGGRLRRGLSPLASEPSELCVECSDLRTATRWDARTVVVNDIMRCGRLCVRSNRLGAVSLDLSGEDGQVRRWGARLCERCDQLSNEDGRLGTVDGRLSTADNSLDHRVRSSRGCVLERERSGTVNSVRGAIE